MSATLKSILSAVLGEAGFVVPTAFVGSSAPDDMQMVYIARAATDAIIEEGLSENRRTATVTLTSSETYALPSDFLGMVPDTANTQGEISRLRLPTGPEEWNFVRASGLLQGSVIRARFIGGQLQVDAPVAGTVITFEYLSDAMWTDGADPNIAKKHPDADIDVWIGDNRLLTLGVKWRWGRAKGLPDWQTDAAEYGAHLRSVRGRSHGARAISFDAGDGDAAGIEPHANLWVTG